MGYWEHYTRPGGPVWGTTLGGQCGGPLNFNQAQFQSSSNILITILMTKCWGAPLRKFWPVDPSPLAGGPRFGNFGPWTPLRGPLGGPASEIFGPCTPHHWPLGGP